MKKIIIFLILILISLRCTQNDTLTAKDMKTIVDRNNDKLGEFFILGNPDSIASMYSKNAVVSPNGDDFYVGFQQILDMNKIDTKEAKILKMRTETMHVNGNREVIYETGKTYLTISLQDTTYDTHIKYCNVWKLQKDGSYKLDVDIWNRDKVKK